MAKQFSILLMIVLVSVLIFGGCAAPAPAPAPPALAPGPEPTTVPTPAAPAPTPEKPIELTFSEQDPAVGWGPVYAWQPMIKGMEEVTNHRIKIEYYPGQTLCKGVDSWEATKSGITDISWCFHGYWAGMTPLADVITLPFMPVPSAEAGSAVLWQLYEKYPSIKDSFAGNYIQLLWTAEPYFIITTEKQVKTLEDLQGMKMRTVGGPPVDMWEKLGAVPMRIPMPDYYLALEKGTIDGGGIPWEAVEDVRLYEVVKYYTYVSLYSCYFSIAWNWDSWNGLPPDIQKAIMDNYGGLKGSKYGGREMFDTAAEQGPELVRKEGYELIEYTLPPEEVARWREIAGENLWDDWVAKMEAQGYSEAQDVLNDCLEMLKAYK